MTRPTRIIIGALTAVLIIAAAAAYLLRTNRSSVILISLDTLRADRLGSYGYARPTSPTLDAFAGESVLFENVIAPAPWTLPSHASLFTGLYPTSHGVDLPHGESIPSDKPMLAEILKRAGYATQGFHGGGYMAQRFGFARGFDDYREVRPPSGQFKGSFRAVVDRAQEFLNGIPAGKPYFLFLHTYDIHCPYQAPEEYFSRFHSDDAEFIDPTKCGSSYYNRRRLTKGNAAYLSNHYDSNIRMVDDVFERFLQQLKKRPDYYNTIIIVLSDHGEEFLEHGRIGHKKSLHAELLRVPLLIKAPGVKPQRNKTSVSLVDILPTIADLLQLTVPADLQGVSLRSALSGKENTIRPFQFSELALRKDLRSYFDSDYHLIVDLKTPEAKLYSVQSDPAEAQNLADSQPEKLEGINKVLKDFMNALPIAKADGVVTENSEDLEQLKTLGYIK